MQMIKCKINVWRGHLRQILVITLLLQNINKQIHQSLSFELIFAHGAIYTSWDTQFLCIYHYCIFPFRSSICTYLVLLHSIICCINFSTLYILSPTIYNIACVNNTSPSGSAAVVKIFEFLSGFMEVSFIEMICSDQSAYKPQSMRARPRHSSERGRETWWSLSTSDIRKTGALCKFSFKANLVALKINPVHNERTKW